VRLQPPHIVAPRLEAAHLVFRFTEASSRAPAQAQLDVVQADGQRRSTQVDAKIAGAPAPGLSLKAHLRHVVGKKMLADMEGEAHQNHRFDYRFLAEIGRMRFGLADATDHETRTAALNSMRAATERLPQDQCVEQIYLAHLYGSEGR
jgi:hypothetical protein